MNGMVRHAPGANELVSDCFLTIRQMICTKPVREKVMNINGSACMEYSTGMAHNNAIHSFTSPAPIPPFAHVSNRTRLANQRSGEPGKFTISPAIRRGSEYQLGIRLVRKSYRPIDKTKMNNQNMVVHHIVI